MMDRIVITKMWHGITSMQVCAEKDVSDDEILKVCNSQNPSGTTGGWSQVVRDDTEHPGRNPAQCDDDPERLHQLIGVGE